MPAGPFLPLDQVTLRSGKVVHGWACQGDADPGTLMSNTFTMEWPANAGRQEAFPEVDRCAWFGVAEARRRINPSQAAFLDRLQAGLVAQRLPREDCEKGASP